MAGDMNAPSGWIFIGPYIVPVARRILVADIQEAVAGFYGLPLQEMTSARRSAPVAQARQIAMYLARDLTPRSLPDIARRFGDRDHTTVWWAVKAVTKRRSTDPELDRDIRLLSAQIRLRRDALPSFPRAGAV